MTAGLIGRPAALSYGRALRTWLAIIGERVALQWVIEKRRMAFPPGHERLAGRVQRGDRLLLYTTRGCFHSPGKDRGRVMGEATVSGAVRAFAEPTMVADRPSTTGCALCLARLAPARGGVELATHVNQLDVLGDRSGWATMLRRPLLSCPSRTGSCCVTR